MNRNFIILGGGQAAVYAAREIRKNDKESNIKILSEENFLPYERPPLSKDFLLNKKNQEDLFFHSSDVLKNENIDFENISINKVDFENKKLFTKNDDFYSYDSLLISTGSENKKLNLDNNLNDDIYYLRNLEEAKTIKEKVSNKNKITIIGGGFIGLEIASSLSQLQKKVTVIEIGSQLMGRIIPKQIADLVQKTHIEYGNEIILNKQINKIIKKNGIYEILLNDNSLIETDFLIAGIGSAPSVKLFENTNLKLDNGIVTNEFCETSIKNVYAAGDVSNFYHPLYERTIRLESYQHAQNHGICAGKNIAGVKTEYTSIPWMWSDQFNLNLQLTGICDDYDEIIERGNDINNGVIYFFLKNKNIRGACGLGIAGKVGRDIRITSKLTEKNIIVDKQILADQNQKLNKLIQK
ncbi:FAD-dependent oxidoreductase [Pelagibacteraceae bacterium]|nr:FAD-dependent oxidoreductase [Pelagibacteraceae bacterium]